MEPIAVVNLREREVVSYPLVLIEGVVTTLASLPLAANECQLEARVEGAKKSTFWPVAVHSGRFKVFVLLPEPGKHVVTLKLGSYCERAFPLAYVPVVTGYVVRFYYQKSADAGKHDGFDAPPGVDNSDAAAMNRIRFNALVMQMATAEFFRDAGLPRRTFALEFGPDGLPVVHLLRTTFSNAEARSINDQKLIRLVHQDIENQGYDEHPEFQYKHAVILGCSAFNAKTQKAEGHTALGGERVGVFGSCGIHAWPSQLTELTACCLNNGKIDKTRLMDDSCFRGTFWANYATGLGAFLHELGHTFGLGHATSGIMSRGFDDMNRLLCVYVADPRSGSLPLLQSKHDGRVILNHSQLMEVTSRKGAHWNMGSALLLVHCPWISTVAKQTSHLPIISWDQSVRGPVGQGTYDGDQKPFSVFDVNRNAPNDLGAVLIDVNHYLDSIQAFSRAEIASWDEHKLNSTGHKHLIVLLPDEYLTRIDVRAGSWIDGIQFHTNLRTTRWFGGFGGSLKLLKPADGSRIHGFFGSEGDHHVGTFGVYCSPIPSDLQESTPSWAAYSYLSSCSSQPSAKAGLALSDGAQEEFYIDNTPIGAIVIKCDKYVERFRVLSYDDCQLHAAQKNESTYGDKEHVFDLLHGEKLTKVEVKSGHWVDAIRLETNLRKSPWFGGTGGTTVTPLVCPPRHHISGFHGSHGTSFLGSLGILYREDKVSQDASPTSPPPQHYEVHELGVTSDVFSMMGNAASVHVLESQPPIGILLAVQGNVISSIQSFVSEQSFDELVNHQLATIDDNTQLHCIPFEAGEQLLQIDASFLHPVYAPYPECGIIEGVCFHTNKRCSAWYGTYHDSNLRFFMAPRGFAVYSVIGSHTYSSITDIVGHVGPLHADYPPSSFIADGRVLTDSKSYDIRTESTSNAGIESIFLLKKNGGDHLNVHAWTWKHTQHPCPHTWFVPQKVLEHHVDDQGATRKERLLQEYLVGAVDAEGGFNQSGGPP